MSEEKQSELKPGQYRDSTKDVFESPEDVENLDKNIEEEKKKVAKKLEK